MFLGIRMQLLNPAMLLQSVPSFFTRVELRDGEFFFFLRKSSFYEAFSFLCLHTPVRMRQLVDICVLDRPSSAKRFTLVYSLLSLVWNYRINIVLEVGECESIPSLCSLFPNANWSEREAYDLYGVFFEGHPDLRRILTDYGFVGHPMRKDFPLTGYVEVRFDEEQKRVVYEPLELAQEFRLFDFSSPWTTLSIH